MIHRHPWIIQFEVWIVRASPSPTDPDSISPPQGNILRLELLETWVEQMVGEVLEGIPWPEKASRVMGPAMADIDGRRGLQSLLESSAAEAVLEAVQPKLSEYHVLSSRLPLTAGRWIQDVAERIAVQVPFFEPSCFDKQTYFSLMLAVEGIEAGQRLLEDCHGFHPEVVPTGDPNQLVLFAQRQFIPLEAAFPNLDQLLSDYAEWVERTNQQPQAQVHSTSRFAKVDYVPLLPVGFDPVGLTT